MDPCQRLEISNDGRYLVEEEGIMTTKVARYRARSSNNSWDQMSDITYFDDDETKGYCRFTDIMKRKDSSGEYYEYYYLVSVGLGSTCSFRYVEAKPTTGDANTYWPVLFKISIGCRPMDCDFLSMEFFPTNTEIKTSTPPLYMAVSKKTKETGNVYKIDTFYGEVVDFSTSFYFTTADVTESNQRGGGRCSFYLRPLHFVDEKKKYVVVAKVYDGLELPSVMDLTDHAIETFRHPL